MLGKSLESSSPSSVIRLVAVVLGAGSEGVPWLARSESFFFVATDAGGRMKHKNRRRVESIPLWPTPGPILTVEWTTPHPARGAGPRLATPV
jgi:hypothetical protein